ncbi:MmpS family transport accessory protein [Micromonospora sp. NPDC023814]|uniref:MmpS family transport accessory protein n=1 Tax=Micromonospora sp. NPDC023814 TaxID=3154596 RepID=UPI003408D423
MDLGVAAGAVVVVGICACLGLADRLVSPVDEGDPDRPLAHLPYPYQQPAGGGWPTAEPAPTTPPSAMPARTVAPARTPSDGPGTVTVVYEVTGRGPADVEYYDANGDFVQTEGVTLPWRMRLRAHDAERVMVLATGPDRNSTIGCRITVDGRAAAEDAGRWQVTCNKGTTG